MKQKLEERQKIQKRIDRAHGGARRVRRRRERAPRGDGQGRRLRREGARRRARAGGGGGDHVLRWRRWRAWCGEARTLRPPYPTSERSSELAPARAHRGAQRGIAAQARIALHRRARGLARHGEPVRGRARDPRCAGRAAGRAGACRGTRRDRGCADRPRRSRSRPASRASPRGAPRCPRPRRARRARSVPGLRPRPTRPRSWCSCASPKRSAFSTIISVAFATSTPTSTTVVDTSTCVSPDSKRAIAAWRAAVSSRPCTRSTRALRQRRGDPLRRLARRAQVALLRLLDQRIDHVGLLAARDRLAAAGAAPRAPRPCARAACAPAAGPAAARRARSDRDRRAASSRACAGSASRSSRACAAARRRSPAPRSAARWRTPKRCCSSTTTSPRLRNATVSWSSACVPTATSISPAASCAADVLGVAAATPTP